MARHQRRWMRFGLGDRDAILLAAAEEQAREHEAAVRRILQEATQLLPTVPSAPLLTPGQEFRSGGRP